MSMRVTVGVLRTIIREEVIREEVSQKTALKALQLVKRTLGAVDGYLRAVKHRSDDPGKFSKEIKECAAQLSVLAQWMLKHREPQAEAIAKTAKVADDLSKSVGFWQRPTMVGREEYVTKVEELTARLKKFAIEARNASRDRAA